MSRYQTASRKRGRTSSQSSSGSDCHRDSPPPRCSNPNRYSSSISLERDTRSRSPDSSSDSDDYPEEYEDYLACPLWKHNPKRYAHVRDICTTGWGFADCGKLTEHMRRVHTRMHGCLSCGHRFTNISKGNFQNAKAAHKCKPDDIRKFKLDSRYAPELLSEKQEERYNALTFARGNSSETPKAVFEKIYRALWPEASDVPSHYHKPGPIQPTYKVEKQKTKTRQREEELRQAYNRIKELEDLLRKSQLNGRAHRYDPRSEIGSSTVPGRLTCNIKEISPNNPGLQQQLPQTTLYNDLPPGLGDMLTDGPGPFEYTLEKGLGSEGRDSGLGTDEGTEQFDKDTLFSSTINSDLMWWSNVDTPDITIPDWSDEHSLEVMES